MMVSADQTRILKPLDQGARSLHEQENYMILRRTPLGPFLCAFHGTRELHKAEYMELESCYGGMGGPCATLDLKIGVKTWDESASASKVAKGQKKLNDLKGSTAWNGYRVSGVKAGGVQVSPQEGRLRGGFTREELLAWLLPAVFSSTPGFGAVPPGRRGSTPPTPIEPDNEVDVSTAREVLGHLRLVSAAAEAGFGGQLRSASLLLTREMRLGGKWCLKLIDLAHFTQVEAPHRDDNFCDGVKNLVLMWEEWLDQCPGKPC